MKKTKLLYIFLMLLSIGACRNWDEDFNTNTNRPQVGGSMPPSYFIGTMIDGTFLFSESMFNVMTPTVMHTAKYKSLSQANRHRAWHDLDGNIWPKAYSSMKHVKNLRRAAIASKDNRYVAIADIWESYLMYTLTNMYGPIPYFDVVADSEDIKYLISYDPQDKIYTAIMEKLKNASQLIKSDDKPVDVSSDYVYGGDIQKWKRFANTLRFKMALNMSNINLETAKTVMNEIVSKPGDYPMFASNADNFGIRYDGVTRKSYYYNQGAWLLEQNLLSVVLVERLISMRDPRLVVYGKPVEFVNTDGTKYILPTNKGKDKYIGMFPLITDDNGCKIWNVGVAGKESNQLSSRIGENFIPWQYDLDGKTQKVTEAAAKVPVIYSTYAELKFALAEATYKKWIPGNAEQLYNEGIKASFEQYNCSFTSSKYINAYAEDALTDANAYLAQTNVKWDGGRDQRLLIAEQKWLTSFHMGFEGYVDYRRTMLPLFPASNKADGYSDGSGSKFPARADYPDSEAAENVKAYAEARSTGFDIPITGPNNRSIAKMWLLQGSSPSLQMFIVPEPAVATQYPGKADYKAWYDTNWKNIFYWLR